MTRYASLAPDLVERLRADQRNTDGSPAARVVADGGEPVRCCLGYAEPGERLVLVGVPLGLPAGSPYDGSSAVYLHADDGCRLGPLEKYPAAWRGRRQIVRAYDERGWIVDAAEHDGSEPEAAIEALLALPRVAQVISFNVLWGCFMLRATPGS